MFTYKKVSYKIFSLGSNFVGPALCRIGETQGDVFLQLLFYIILYIYIYLYIYLFIAFFFIHLHTTLVIGLTF